MTRYPNKLTLRKDWRMIAVFMLIFAATYFSPYGWLQVVLLMLWSIAFVVVARKAHTLPPLTEKPGAGPLYPPVVFPHYDLNVLTEPAISA